MAKWEHGIHILVNLCVFLNIILKIIIVTLSYKYDPVIKYAFDDKI